MKRPQPVQLYWKQLLIGYVNDADCSDFPCVVGKVELNEIPSDLREALEYLYSQSLTDEGVTDWPFSDEFEVDWTAVYSDGSCTEICEPLIDFETCRIKWS
jgi:hypothetical protein